MGEVTRGFLPGHILGLLVVKGCFNFRELLVTWIKSAQSRVTTMWLSAACLTNSNTTIQNVTVCTYTRAYTDTCTVTFFCHSLYFFPIGLKDISSLGKTKRDETKYIFNTV